MNSEQLFVNELVPTYITSAMSSQSRVMRDLIVRTFSPFIRRGRALELGCEIGYMTEKLSKLVDHIDIVDGAQEFLDMTKERHISNASYFNCLFEEFESKPIYDWVFANHVLEHLQDVPTVLNMVKRVLKPSGYLFVTVPNAKALSRQLARHMGVIKDLYELTPNDIRGGHRRVYDKVLLKREMKNNGLDIILQGGIFFKPFADFQLDKMINSKIIGEQQIEGLYSLGDDYPDMCADIYAICKNCQSKCEQI
jgi:2-polyprenyl-3-methyl-5-hydroxy-6-metoxy-1,4-benzoquinol methylase